MHKLIINSMPILFGGLLSITWPNKSLQNVNASISKENAHACSGNLFSNQSGIKYKIVQINKNETKKKTAVGTIDTPRFVFRLIIFPQKLMKVLANAQRAS
jgi:hypothetical protein